MVTTTKKRQGEVKVTVGEGLSVLKDIFETSLSVYSDAKDFEINITDNILSISFLLEGKRLQIFITQVQLIAASNA
jgi:hypothetical protein